MGISVGALTTVGVGLLEASVEALWGFVFFFLKREPLPLWPGCVIQGITEAMVREWHCGMGLLKQEEGGGSEGQQNRLTVDEDMEGP